MTDLPRKAFPLVVAPPGGFEDAVRRGRRRRRQRTGGSTGAALALVGVLAYAVMGDQGGGSDRLDTTQRPDVEQTVPAVIPSGGPVTTTGPRASAPVPTSSPKAAKDGNPVAGPTRNPDPGPGPVDVPASVRPSNPISQPTRQPEPTPRYAARGEIRRTGPDPITEDECLARQDAEWCTAANVDDYSSDQAYTLDYVVCRGVGAGPGTVSFARKPQVDFTAIEVKNNDPVWTYSAGQPVVAEPDTITIPEGNCVMWRTVWDGLDDFGRLPAKGDYVLRARSFATAPSLPPAEFNFVLK